MKSIATLLAAIGFSVCVVAASLPDSEVKEAIALGAGFKSADKFLEDGLKSYKFKVAGVMATDGTSKYLTLTTDYTAIAAASADAHRRLKDLTTEDVAAFPNTGLIQVIAEMHARGAVPVHRMQGRYGQGRTHLVIMMGDAIVQPLDQKVLSDIASPAYRLWIFSSTAFGNLGWVLVQPAGGWPEEKIVSNFSFALTNEQRHAKGKLILIDGNGSKDPVDVDLSKLK